MMEHEQLYRSIAERTGGDIYIGVVGPVRSGKSTFVKKLAELAFLPAIHEELSRSRARDEYAVWKHPASDDRTKIYP